MVRVLSIEEVDKELVKLFKAEGATDGEIIDMASNLRVFNIVDPKRFLGFFAPGNMSVAEFWRGVPGWSHQGALLSHLRGVLKLLLRRETEAEEKEASLLDLRLDNPIDANTNKSLTSTWTALYGFRLHPSQEGTNQILGSIWRRLQTRQLQAEEIKGIHTLQTTGGIEPNKRQWKVGDFKFFDKDEMEKGKEQAFRVSTNPFLFLCAQEVQLRTLAKAGSYWVTDPEDDRSPEEKQANPQRLNIERELIEDHLAECRSFVIEWTTKSRAPRNEAVTQQLARIDMRIREKWCRLYMKNLPEGKTFSKCIRETLSTAESLWSADLSKEMPSGKGNGGSDGKKDQGGKFQKGERNRKKTASKGAPKGANSKGGKRGSKGGNSKGAGSVSFGKPIKVKNGAMAKTARSKGDKSFCMFWNEGKCTKGSSCTFLHSCNVLTAQNQVCMAKHMGKDHGGNSI